MPYEMDRADKVVILARGLGTRMRKQDADALLDRRQAAIAETGVKALIPLAAGDRARPFLDYILHAVAEAGYRRFCLVIGPEHRELRDYYENELKPTRISIEFAIQEKPLGTANAVAAAELFADGDDFLMLNSDNFYPTEACRLLRELNGTGVAVFDRDAMIRRSNISADRIQKFAVAIITANGRLARVIEKPGAQTIASLGQEVYVSMNCWRFSSAIFNACRAIGPSSRGEYEITDAVQYAIDRLGESFCVVRSNEPVLDLSHRSDIASVSALLRDAEVRL
ncbi:MAG TPA: nucleotidyltransferase family protein [Tepidisphaeraceae bacterium]|nr:nucleotidyltransferase family protein [Tepidisphaeraceae bacterium]